jgi:hypothetical protein
MHIKFKVILNLGHRSYLWKPNKVAFSKESSLTGADIHVEFTYNLTSKSGSACTTAYCGDSIALQRPTKFNNTILGNSNNHQLGFSISLFSLCLSDTLTKKLNESLHYVVMLYYVWKKTSLNFVPSGVVFLISPTWYNNKSTMDNDG